MTIEKALKTINKYCSNFLIPSSEKPFFEKSVEYEECIKSNFYDEELSWVSKKFYSFEEFIEAAVETQNVEIDREVKGRLRTENYTFQIVKNKNLADAFFELPGLSGKVIATFKNTSVSLESHPFIHSIATIAKKLTKKSDPLLQYDCVIQIKFLPNATNSPSSEREKIEDDIINCVLFELEDFFDLQFEIEDFYSPPPGLSFEYSPEGDNSKFQELTNSIFENLELYDEKALKLFRNSQQVTDERIKLFSIYRVFEYFGPIVITLELHDELKKILGHQRADNPDLGYLHSIEKIATNFKDNFYDNKQIERVFKACTDCRNLEEYMPEFLKNAIENNRTWEKKTKKIANTLFDTRNYIVHAKANHRAKSGEIVCPDEELSQFNIFLRRAAAQVIKWHKSRIDPQ